jgi:hypothetical protein
MHTTVVHTVVCVHGYRGGNVDQNPGSSRRAAFFLVLLAGNAEAGVVLAAFGRGAGRGAASRVGVERLDHGAGLKIRVILDPFIDQHAKHGP